MTGLATGRAKFTGDGACDSIVAAGSPNSGCELGELVGVGTAGTPLGELVGVGTPEYPTLGGLGGGPCKGSPVGDCTASPGELVGVGTTGS